MRFTSPTMPTLFKRWLGSTSWRLAIRGLRSVRVIVDEETPEETHHVLALGSRPHANSGSPWSPLRASLPCQGEPLGGPRYVTESAPHSTPPFDISSTGALSPTVAPTRDVASGPATSLDNPRPRAPGVALRRRAGATLL